MTSSRPMSFPSSVASVFYLAETAADDFSSAPTVFRSGEQAATELILELRSYQQFHAARNNNSPNSQAAFESSLTANLRPCHDALQAMLAIRRNYGSDKNLGFVDRARWMRDERQFEQHAASLRQDTARLRELIQELQRSATVSSTSAQQQHDKPSREHGFGAPALQTRTTVSFGGIQYTAQPPQQPPVPSTTNFTANRYFQTQSQDPKPTMMCPNGSGCRTPLCHKTYRHPDAPECSKGKNCGIQNCDKWHPKSPLCPTGSSCSMIGCNKAHPWPRDPPQAVSPISYAPSGSGFHGSMSDVSSASTMGTGPTLTARAGPVAQPEHAGLMPFHITGRPPLLLLLARTNFREKVQSTLATGNPGNPSINTTSNQAWCDLKFKCPGGYNGVCPKKHPSKRPCWDFTESGRCPKGASCTFLHSVEAPAVQSWNAKQGGERYIAELPARR